jgi:hypothetical protein
MVRSLVLSSVFLAAAAGRADANFVFTATLTGSQENPPVTTTATGFAVLTLNAARTALVYEVTIRGIDFTGQQTPTNDLDNLTLAHIHRAPVGSNGPVVFGFFGSPINETTPGETVVTPFATGVGGTITGKWDAGEGNNTTLTAELSNLFAGGLYLNFHTRGFPGGEVRGQITPVPAPAGVVLGLVGVGTLGLGRIRRRAK